MSDALRPLWGSFRKNWVSVHPLPTTIKATDYLIREQMLQKKELQAISMGDLKKVLGGKE